MEDKKGRQTSPRHFHESYWNMMQLLAWVHTGDVELVHKASERSVGFGSIQIEIENPSGESKITGFSAQKISISRLIVEGIVSKTESAPDIQETKDQIIDALRCGRLAAIGIETKTSISRKIEAEEWVHLEIFERDDKEICARRSSNPGKYQTRFVGLKIKSDEALSIWPPRSAAESEPTRAQTKRERQIRAIEAAADRLGFSRTAVPKYGKKALQTHCKSMCPDLFGAGVDPFLEAWKDAVKQNRIRMKEHEKYSRR